jgi:hypothetical protein
MFAYTQFVIVFYARRFDERCERTAIAGWSALTATYAPNARVVMKKLTGNGK